MYSWVVKVSGLDRVTGRFANGQFTNALVQFANF